MNQESSRSHCIVTVTVEKAAPDGTVTVGKLKMVDLAGRSVTMNLTSWLTITVSAVVYRLPLALRTQRG